MKHSGRRDARRAGGGAPRGTKRDRLSQAGERVRLQGTGWRLWVLRLLSLLLAPVLSFLVLEAGLRLGGYGFPAGTTIPTRVEGVYRVFVLGASAAQGTLDPPYSFGRLLEVMLDSACAPRDAEVTVVAMPATNSHTVVEMAKDLAGYQADLFVVYLGNNEVVGPYGPGTVFALLSPHLALIRASLRVRATRTGQMLANAIDSLRQNPERPEVWAGMEMFRDRQVVAEDPRLYVRAVDLEERGDYAGAASGYMAAAEIDGRFANLQFRLARCYWLTGEREKARARFILARRLDVLRFRPGRRINEIIRQVGADGSNGDVHLVDIDKILQERSASGVPGSKFFHEHVHFNFHGNYLVARAVFQKTTSLRASPVGDLDPNQVAAPVDRQCAERLAYNEWARYNVLFKVLNYCLAEPPFTQQLYHDERVARLKQEVQSLEAGLTPEVRAQIAAQYGRLIERHPGDIWLRLRFAEFSSVQLADEATATRQCERVEQLVPHSCKPHLLLALSLGRLDRVAEAIPHLQRAVEIKPTCGQAFHLPGLAYQSRRQPQKAMAAFRRAVTLSPDDVEAYRQMVQMLCARGKLQAAENLLHQALLAAPDDPSLYDRLGAILRDLGRQNEADNAFETAARLRLPTSPARRE